MKTDRMIKLIYKSLDGVLGSRQSALLEKALGVSPELRSEREKILRIREILGRQNYRFAPGFAGRVMESIAGTQVLKPLFDPEQEFNFMFKRFALTGSAAILILLVSLYLSSGSFDLNLLLGVERFSEDSLITYLLFNQ